jgi:flagellar basal body-associated protein FliL
MADPKKDTSPAAGKDAGAPKKNKLPLIIGGGAISMIAIGYMLAVMAIPAKHAPKPHIEGPFVSPLSKTDVQVNLAGEGGKRYLLMALQAEYLAYDETYVKGRLGLKDGGTEDEVYTAQLKDALLSIASTKTREQVTNPVMLDGFLEEVRVALEPILFPVYIGDTLLPGAADKHSGLRVGDASAEMSFRGFLHEHAVFVDGQRQLARFDNGALVTFEGNERNLWLANEKGERVTVNVSGLHPEFKGEVPIGIPGKVRRIYRNSLLVQ